MIRASDIDPGDILVRRSYVYSMIERGDRVEYWTHLCISRVDIDHFNYKFTWLVIRPNIGDRQYSETMYKDQHLYDQELIKATESNDG